MKPSCTQGQRTRKASAQQTGETVKLPACGRCIAPATQHHGHQLLTGLRCALTLPLTCRESISALAEAVICWMDEAARRAQGAACSLSCPRRRRWAGGSAGNVAATTPAGLHPAWAPWSASSPAVKLTQAAPPHRLDVVRPKVVHQRGQQVLQGRGTRAAPSRSVFNSARQLMRHGQAPLSASEPAPSGQRVAPFLTPS